jgi:hypothetical protein
LSTSEPITDQSDAAPDRCALEMNTLDDAARAVDAALQALGQASQDLYRCRYGSGEVEAALEWNSESEIEGGPLSRELRADAIVIERMRKVVAEFAQDKKNGCR